MDHGSKLVLVVNMECAGAQTTTASLLFATGIKTVPDPLKASTFTWKGMVNVGQRHGEWKRVADGPVEVVNRDVFGESHSGKRERIERK